MPDTSSIGRSAWYMEDVMAIPSRDPCLHLKSQLLKTRDIQDFRSESAIVNMFPILELISEAL